MNIINFIFLGCCFGFFGNDCKNVCGKCLNGVCDYVIGCCVVGCKLGWIGLNCFDSELY